jgi:hypothetical protein
MNVMDKQNYPEIDFGCTALLPLGLRCAWGARATCKRGVVDIPLDLQMFFGAAEDRRQLEAWLNGGALAELAARVLKYHREGSLGIGNKPQAYVWDDWLGMIFGQYQGGYLYLAAFIHGHAPDVLERDGREPLRGFRDSAGNLTQGADRLMEAWGEIDGKKRSS